MLRLLRAFERHWPRLSGNARMKITIDGVTYLTRTRIIDRAGLGLYLHHFDHPDPERDPHDHPWGFISLILAGEYIEQVGATEHHHKPGDVLVRPAEFAHRVAHLPKGECWTLVLHGPKCREWGFHVDGRWVGWRDYLNLGS